MGLSIVWTLWWLPRCILPPPTLCPWEGETLTSCSRCSGPVKLAPGRQVTRWGLILSVEDSVSFPLPYVHTFLREAGVQGLADSQEKGGADVGDVGTPSPLLPGAPFPEEEGIGNLGPPLGHRGKTPPPSTPPQIG